VEVDERLIWNKKWKEENTEMQYKLTDLWISLVYVHAKRKHKKQEKSDYNNCGIANVYIAITFAIQQCKIVIKHLEQSYVVSRQNNSVSHESDHEAFVSELQRIISTDLNTQLRRVNTVHVA